MKWSIEIISLVVAVAGVVISTIAAIFAAGSYRLAKRNDRGYIRAQIRYWQSYIQKQNSLKFVNRHNSVNGICEEDCNIANAKREIAELEERL